MFVLPVSRTTVAFRLPTGYDDAVLTPSSSDGVAMRVDVVRRLAPPAPPGCQWDSLPYVDVDAALLGLRQFLLGDRLVAEVQCSTCGSWGDVAFSIDDYLQTHRSRRRSAPPTLASVPTVADVLAALREHGSGTDAASALETAYLRRCGDVERRRAIARLEQAAPLLGDAIAGVCPQCGAGVSAWFDPGGFVLAEMRPRADALFADVHRIASAYGWNEDGILALPASRRAAYAELIDRERMTR